jgi:hypothetical protein
MTPVVYSPLRRAEGGVMRTQRIEFSIRRLDAEETRGYIRDGNGN